MTAKELIEGFERMERDTYQELFHDSIMMILEYLVEQEKPTTPTIEESSTVAPDPGEGWRLIDPEEDTPQEGDEMWMPGDLRWEKRWYPTVGFSPVCHYRRRIEAATPNVAELPEGLPPLPEGAVYLGQGGTFNRNNGLFEGWECSGKQWWRGKHEGDDERCHYAAPADSEVARLNGLGVEPAADVEGKWSKAIRIDALEQQINALTKERDEARNEAIIWVERCEEKDAESRKWQSKYEQLRAACMAFNNVIHMTNAAKKEASQFLDMKFSKKGAA